MKTESDLAKNNFLARMSHEMRTPLNVIIGMTTIAQTMNNTKELSACLSKINEASVHLLAMINSVLDLAKIETGNFYLTNAEFNLRQGLRKATETVKFVLEAKKQDLKLDYDLNLPEIIISDEQRFIQLLENLLSNAVKFTPPGGTVTLSVKNLAEDDKTHTLGIEVTDTGIGISTEEMQHVFALFEQVDGGLARKQEGAGMGLSISAKIVQLMGGEISVHSEPGKGSSFSFQITTEKPAEPVSENTSSPGLTEGEEKFSGKTIILAEDVEINREIVMSVFENTALAIDCAGNGLEALEKYKASPEKYSLILMDIHMPEMDGYEATRQIRAFENELRSSSETPERAWRNVPIIAMTANVFKEDVEKCFEAGMSGHLGKPVDFEELMSTLEKHLSPSL
jgi:CheY-like chemotaxis protein